MSELAYVPEPSTLTRLKWFFRDLRYRFVGRWRRGCDWLKWIGYKPGNLETYAHRELELAGWFKEDGFYGDMMGHAVMGLVRDFSEEGHSGMSAPLAINLFKTVAAFEPLTPLTGEDEEWNEVGDGWFQNRRCSHVFKGGERFNGKPYDGEAVIFEDPDGGRFTSYHSARVIRFPYTPKRITLKVHADDHSLVMAGQEDWSQD